MQRPHSRAIAVTLVFAVLGAPLAATRTVHAQAAADEDKKKEASAHYDRAVQLYKEGAYEASLVEFQRAYEILPNFRILYNMGQIRYEMNRFAAALKLFQRYLAEGGADVPADRKASVEKLIGELQLRVATITINVDEPDAVVRVDDVEVGRSPLAEPILVDIGYRKITATKDGKTDTKVITVAGGDKPTVALSVAPEAVTPAPIGEKKPTPTVTSSSFPWVPWAITGVLAAGTVTMGILTLGKKSALADERANPNATRDSLDSAYSREKTFALATDILGGATVVMAGVSLYMTLSRPKAPKPTDTGAVSVDVHVGFGSVALTGSF